MDHYCNNIEGWFNFPDVYRHAVQTNNDAQFVEVGSWQGKSAVFMAVEIANANKNIRLYCVDPWEGSIEHKDEEVVKNGTLYETFLKNIESVKHIITPVRLSSIDAALKFPDESLDFVFIDAAHDYQSVRQDLHVWLPKLKKGGRMAGHDHNWPGVSKAVNEFVTDFYLTLDWINVQDCWGFIKPGRLIPDCSPEARDAAIKSLGKL